MVLPRYTFSHTWTPGTSVVLGILLLDLIGQFVKYDSPVNTIFRRSYTKARARTHHAAVRGVSHGALGLRALQTPGSRWSGGVWGSGFGFGLSAVGSRGGTHHAPRKRRARGFETEAGTLSFSRVVYLIPPTQAVVGSCLAAWFGYLLVLRIFGNLRKDSTEK